MSNASVAAVFDLDRTITRAGTWTPYLLYCAPLTPSRLWRFTKALAAVLAYVLKRISRKDLKARMVHLWIAGTPRAQIDLWSDAFTARWLESRVRPGALAAIARHRAAGDHLVLATASFDFYARVFAARLGFDHVVATESVWDDEDRLCAAVAGENCYGQAKLDAVKTYFAAHPSTVRTVAYSDHHSDFGLLRWAHEGVAVNPNAKLRRMAAEHNLTIVDWEA
jgi:phosphatidylglycerophosphatase C